MPSVGSVVAFRDPDNIQLELFVLASGFQPAERRWTA